MKTLLLMRHAKSSWKYPDLSDHDRPLKSRGKRDAPKMGEFLVSKDLIPQVILCSTARRAKETVEYFLRTCPFEGEVIYRRNLYHGGAEEFINAMQGLQNEINIVMIVGHNPGMEYSIEEFCGVDEFFPTTAIAYIQFEIDKWADMDSNVGGKLISLWRPKEI